MQPTVLTQFCGRSLCCRTELGSLAAALRMPMINETTFYLGVDEISHDLLLEATVITPTGAVLSTGVRRVDLRSGDWTAAQNEAEAFEDQYRRDEEQFGPSIYDGGWVCEPIIVLIEQQRLWGLLLGLVVQLASSVAGLTPVSHLLTMSATHEVSSDSQGRRIANPRPANKPEDDEEIQDDGYLPF